jgi:predicted TIM-barrel fold metal-dependent hydrolase
LNREGTMMDRRIFLAATAGVVASPLLGAEDDLLPVVDTHVHLWDLKRLKLPWIKEGDTLLGHDFLIADYNAATKDQNVVKAVYLEVDVAPDQKTREAEAVIEYCRRADTPVTGAVIGGVVADEGFPKYLDQFRNKHAIKGVRQVLHGDLPKGTCLTKEFQRGLAALAERDMHFELCMRVAELPDAAACIKALPDLRFVLDHCGNPNPAATDLTTWKRDLAALAKLPNVVGKVSGFLANAPEGKWKPEQVAPIVNHMWESFGPDRVMFGGDWPVVLKATPLAGWLGALRAVIKDRPREQQRKLLHDNAIRFYRLW